MALGLLPAAGWAGGSARAAHPSIKLSGPHSVALGTNGAFKASGYFNNTKAHPSRGANFAVVYRPRGSVKPTGTQCYKHGRYVAGGVAEKQWRAKTPTTPGHFSAKFKVKGTKAGTFTLCALMGNYPYTGIFRRPHAILHYTVQ